MVSMTIRIPDHTYDVLQPAAQERGVSLHWLIIKILAESADRLGNPDEFRVTQ